MTTISVTDIIKHLSGMNFPARKKEIIAFAKEKDVPGVVATALEALPEDELFENPQEVAEAIEVELTVLEDDEEEEALGNSAE